MLCIFFNVINVKMYKYINVKMYKCIFFNVMRFLHTTSSIGSYKHFTHPFGILNFLPKLTILQPMHDAQFWPFSKCSHSANIRWFLERLLAHDNSNVLAHAFFALFWHF